MDSGPCRVSLVIWQTRVIALYYYEDDDGDPVTRGSDGRDSIGSCLLRKRDREMTLQPRTNQNKGWCPWDNPHVLVTITNWMLWNTIKSFARILI